MGQGAIDREDERKEAAADQVEDEGDDPQPDERGDQPPVRVIDGRRGRVEEVLVEQLRPTDDEEHEADAEGQRPGELGQFAELRPEQRLDDAERDDAEDDCEPRDEAGRDQFEHRLVEPPLSFLHRSVEYLARWGGPCHVPVVDERDEKDPGRPSRPSGALGPVVASSTVVGSERCRLRTWATAISTGPWYDQA